ncbi:MAG: hypothetical protein WC789_09310 [Lentisphaeria bacterium]
MADSTLDSELFLMYDNWPGYATRGTREVPLGGFTGATHHNYVSAVYGVGEAIWVRNESAGQPGWSKFIYLQIGTQNADSAIAVKSYCVPDSATVWYQLTNDPDSCIKIPTPSGVMALSAMTDAYYGWFWAAGVCPEEYVSTLGGNFTTDGNVAAGPAIFHDGTGDYVNLSVADTAPEMACGFALAADV